MHHLLGHGSDGFVIAGTTGEASTMTDDEHLGLIELAVAESRPRQRSSPEPGTNDTRHAVHLTSGRPNSGPTHSSRSPPTTTGPSRRGSSPLRGGRRGHRPAGHTLQHPAARRATCRTTSSPSSRQLDNVLRQAGQRRELAEDRRPRHLRGQRRRCFAALLDLGGAGGILVGSHIFGEEMRRMVDEPEHRARSRPSLQDVYRDLFLTANPTCTSRPR